MAKKLTAKKAKTILKDKMVKGKPLSPAQKHFFGAVAGGQKPYKRKK